MSCEFISRVLGSTPGFSLVSSVGSEDCDSWWVNISVPSVLDGIRDKVGFMSVMDGGDPELELLTEPNDLIEIGRLVTMNVDPDFALLRVSSAICTFKTATGGQPTPTHPDSIRQHLPLVVLRERFRVLLSLLTPPILFLHQFLTLSISVSEIMTGIHTSLLVYSGNVLAACVFRMTSVSCSNELSGSVGMNDFEWWIDLHR